MRTPVEDIREPDMRSLEELAADREDWAEYLELAIALARIKTELDKFPEDEHLKYAKQDLLGDLQGMLDEKEPVI